MTAPAGLGLGLFIAKTLLERSGAKLTFRKRRSGKAGRACQRRMAAHADGHKTVKMTLRHFEPGICKLTLVQNTRVCAEDCDMTERTTEQAAAAR